jgi:SAM-dependent methyltransferase
MWIDTGYSLLTRARRAYAAAIMWRCWRRGHHSWFDHRLDESDWPDRIFWVERGVLGRFHLPMGAKVLDLCCGDGYFADCFWSPSAGHVDAVDRDPDALSFARAVHSKPNVRYSRCDIVEGEWPGVDYDLICFFEAIEHLSEQDGKRVLERIKDALGPSGWLVGSTPAVDQASRGRGNDEHDNEFEGIDVLTEFLSQVFAEPRVFSSYHPARTTLYFEVQKT